MKTKNMVVFAWGLSLVVSLLAVVAWVSGFDLDFGQLNLYLLFPLFGLLAFSLMWAHYIVGAARRAFGVDKQALKPYFATTGWAALLFFVLHPTLLMFQLLKDGAGLPPSSFMEYVAPTLKWAVTLGTLSFLVFLSFETKRWFDKKGWWSVIEYAQVIAMFAIISHALALGSNLQTGWYRFVWLFYSLSLVVSVGYIYYLEAQEAKKEGKFMKKVIAIITVVAIIAGIGVYSLSQSNEADAPAPTSSSQETPAAETKEQKAYSLEEVKKHNGKDDCWTIIEGSVYDITTYIPRHPGGDDILRACGEDGTTLFASRQDESGNDVGSGEPHSSNATGRLESLKIGTLTQ